MRLATLDDVLIGDCGIHDEPAEWGEIEHGYVLAEPYRGLGYGTEVAVGLSRWLLTQDGIRRVVGRAARDNPGGCAHWSVLASRSNRRTAYTPDTFALG
jgi:RimJ/RimL family protein N-acetyltransferase